MVKTGDKYVHEITITQEQVDTFAQISGDNNPIHTDAEYARTTPFGRPIVHGFLSGAVFSKVFGTLFPGEGTIYLYQDMKFMAPVYVDQAYEARFEVMSVDQERHIGTIACTLVAKESGKVCIDGMAKLKNDSQFI